MNFDYNDIMKALENGDTIDNIADNFAKALNKAEQTQREKAEAAKKAKTEKVDMAQAIVEDIMDWCDTYYPDMLDKEKRDAHAAAIQLVDLFDSMDKLSATFGKLGGELKLSKGKEPAKTFKSEKEIPIWMPDLDDNFLGDALDFLRKNK